MEWSFEKETRLLVRINDKDIIAEVGKYIYFDFEDLLKHISFTLGPNCTEDIDLGKTKFSHSSLKDRINMDLCKKCFKDYVSQYSIY